jgi:hypothetical protein
VEAELDRGDLRSHTLSDLLKRYAAEVMPRKRSADREIYMLRVILRHPIARVSLKLLTAAEIAKYRNDRFSKAGTPRRLMMGQQQYSVDQGTSI